MLACVRGGVHTDVLIPTPFSLLPAVWPVGNCGQEATRRLAASDAAAAAEALRVCDLEAQVAATKEHLIEVLYVLRPPTHPNPSTPPPTGRLSTPLALAATVCVYPFPF